jgi:cyclopropane fatty-acyl-phospholipid synthase-like methyltransferase
MTTTTVQHKKKIRTFFDERTAQYDGFYEPRSAWHRWFNRTFRKAVYTRRDEVVTLARRFGCQSLLDVGSGSGRNTAWWANHGLKQLHGIEFSGEMVSEANLVARQANVADRCSFELADFMKWHSPQKYDMVVACGVFDYVVDARAFLQRMAGFASKVIYGSFPRWTLVRSPLRKLRYAVRGCPTHFYRRVEIEEIFETVGFGHVEIKPMDSGFLAWSYREAV